MAVDEVFKLGDGVVHKSGGSMMIVSAIKGTKITCDWMERGQKRQEEFEAITLSRYGQKSEDWQSPDDDGDFMTA
ncbi:MAG: DUF2158 domain-containing protein [Xanthobacteraceae bacterium]